MESINTKALSDETIYPDDDLLKQVLGRSYNAFCELLKLYDRNEMTYEWRYYREGKAWLLKVQKKKRTIVWMSAWKGYIKGVMYFAEKYIQDIYTLPISEENKQRIKQTKNVGKSKPCIFEIRNKKVLKDFETVMHFKIKAK